MTNAGLISDEKFMLMLIGQKAYTCHRYSNFSISLCKFHGTYIALAIVLALISYRQREVIRFRDSL